MAPPWGRSSDGRALQSHCRGQGFDSPRLHHFPTNRGLISLDNSVPWVPKPRFSPISYPTIDCLGSAPWPHAISALDRTGAMVTGTSCAGCRANFSAYDARSPVMLIIGHVAGMFVTINDVNQLGLPALFAKARISESCGACRAQCETYLAFDDATQRPRTFSALD